MVRAGREKNQFLRATGGPARGAADRGPRGTQKLVRTVPKKYERPGRVNKPFFGKFINPVLGLITALGNTTFEEDEDDRLGCNSGLLLRTPFGVRDPADTPMCKKHMRL